MDILHVEGQLVFPGRLCLLPVPASFHFAMNVCNSVCKLGQKLRTPARKTLLRS